MNTPADAAGLVHGVDRAPGGDPAERLPRRVLPAAQARDRRLRRLRPAPGRRRRGLRRGARRCARSSRSGAATPRSSRKPTYQLYTVASRNAGAEVLALEPGDGLALARDGARRARPRTCASSGSAARTTRRARSSTRRSSSASARPARASSCSTRPTSSSAARTSRRSIAGHPNLVVTRTFSKGFALGAARVGYGLAQPPLAEALDALRPPGLDLVVVGRRGRARLPRDPTRCGTRCAAIVEERGRLAAGMRDGGRRRARPGGQLRARALAGARHLRAAGRARAASCARSRTSRCSPTASA